MIDNAIYRIKTYFYMIFSNFITNSYYFIYFKNYMMFSYRETHEKVNQYEELLMRKTDCDFFKTVRVTKTTFHELVGRLESMERFSSTRPTTQSPQPTSAATALAATLWYLGNLNSQRDIAERLTFPKAICVDL